MFSDGRRPTRASNVQSRTLRGAQIFDFPLRTLLLFLGRPSLSRKSVYNGEIKTLSLESRARRQWFSRDFYKCRNVTSTNLKVQGSGKYKTGKIRQRAPQERQKDLHSWLSRRDNLETPETSGSIRCVLCKGLHALFALDANLERRRKRLEINLVFLTPPQC